MSDAEFSTVAVPKQNRKSLVSLSLVLLGLTFFSTSMWTGGVVALGLPFSQILQAIGLGNLLLGIYTAFLGYIGAKTGLTTYLLSRFSFGEVGSYLPSFLLGGTQIGWYGVGAAMLAIPLSKITGLNIYLVVGLTGLLMLSSVFFGIKGITVLSFISIPLITIFGVSSVLLALNDVGGLHQLMQINPIEPITLNKALALVIGSFISAGTMTADITRFSKSPKKAVIVALLAFFIGNALMFVFGAVGAMTVGKADISDVMMAQGLLIPALLVLGLNIWTTNDNALYFSGLAFANISGFKSKSLSLLNGIIGTIFALWFYNNFVSWLTFLSSAIPPIGGVIICDYFLNKARYQNFSEAKFIKINYLAFLAVAVGTLCGYLPFGITPINAVLGAIITYMSSNYMLKLITGEKVYAK